MVVNFKAGWLVRQLEAASKIVNSWPKTKQEVMRLNRGKR